MPDYETILVDVEDRVARITLNRPEKRNAISRQLQNDVLDALATAEVDPGVRVAVISGAGRAFSAGYDVTRGTDESHGHSQGGVGGGQGRSITTDPRWAGVVPAWLVSDLGSAPSGHRQGSRLLPGGRDAVRQHLRRYLRR